MNHDATRSPERAAFGALSALLLAPVIAQGVWHPLQHVFGSAGSASAITWAALAVAAVVVLLQLVLPRRKLALSLALGSLVAVAARVAGSLGLPGLLTLICVDVATAFLVQWLLPQLPTSLDGLGKRHRLLTGLYVVLALAAVVSMARVSVFIGDPTRVDQQVVPGEKFLETHSCLTAYVHAAKLSQQRVDNLYAEQWWHGAHGLPPLPAGVENPYRPFLLDYYAYPPPFLLIMAPLAPLAGDFPAQRALWFGINGLLLAVGLWILARWVDGPGSHRVLLLAPVFLGSLPVLGTLQIGNFQIAVVMLSILAMVAFHQDRNVIGGALLAFAILSKISPGIFGVYLLAQRRFRSAAWTAGFGVFFLLLSLLLHGVSPIQSFLTYTLTRISSGEAFSFLAEGQFNVLTNMSLFGFPFKLQLLGVAVSDPWTVARRLGRIYSVVLVLLAFFAAYRQGDRRTQALTWMSLLVLSALQSPFAPGYVIIGLLWAITLLAVEVQSARGAVTLLVLWIVLTIVPHLSVSLLGIFSILQSAVTIGVPIWLIIHKRFP
ncbi:MAG: DUF2029 domain-containing protein [Myxococcales bacterium]|nr:DUF2029 domain-containing protein [Myxococcales bacterium]